MFFLNINIYYPLVDLCVFSFGFMLCFYRLRLVIIMKSVFCLTVTVQVLTVTVMEIPL